MAENKLSDTTARMSTSDAPRFMPHAARLQTHLAAKIYRSLQTKKIFGDEFAAQR